MPRLSPLWKNRAYTFPALKGELEVDVLVIGGGITGISAAYELSRRRGNFALIDSRHIGDRTGRGTGILHPEADMDVADMIKEYGLAGTKRLIHKNSQALEEIKSLIARYRLRCQFANNGSLAVALKAQDISLLRKEFKAKQKAGEVCAFLEGLGVQRVVNASVFAAIHCPGDCVFNQERFIFELGSRIRDRVRIFERTPALSITKQKSFSIVRTPTGIIRARKIILAAGGAESLRFIRLRRKIHAYTCFVIASRPLTKDQRALLNWKKGHALWPLGKFYNFIRLTTDHRLVVGGEESFGPLSAAGRKKRFRKLKSFIFELFPQLKNLEIDHEWSGEVYYAKGGLPQTGRQGNIFYGFAYAGTGLLTGFGAGRDLARRTQEEIRTN